METTMTINETTETSTETCPRCNWDLELTGSRDGVNVCIVCEDPANDDRAEALAELVDEYSANRAPACELFVLLRAGVEVARGDEFALLQFVHGRHSFSLQYAMLEAGYVLRPCDDDHGTGRDADGNPGNWNDAAE